MSFFEEMYVGAKNIGVSVSQKTNHLVDVAKLRISAAEIENEISNRYKSLGKAIYDARKSGISIDGIVDECVNSIDALNDRYDEVSARIAGIQNKTRCTVCGATVDQKAIYCSRCGARVEKSSKRSAGLSAAKKNTDRKKNDEE